MFHVQKDAGHNTEWWPNERAAFEQFVDQHPRNPLPDRLSWQTETTERYNRFDWLIIDRLGHVRGEASLPDSNRIEMEGETYFIFPQSELTGRVDLVRRGNTVEVSTTGVQAFTLLLSPSLFDFSKPITVNVNGRRVFQKRVQRSIATLLVAARDNDRTALFGAEVQIGSENSSGLNDQGTHRQFKATGISRFRLSAAEFKHSHSLPRPEWPLEVVGGELSGQPQETGRATTFPRPRCEPGIR